MQRVKVMWIPENYSHLLKNFLLKAVLIFKFYIIIFFLCRVLFFSTNIDLYVVIDD